MITKMVLFQIWSDILRVYKSHIKNVMHQKNHVKSLVDLGLISKYFKIVMLILHFIN